AGSLSPFGSCGSLDIGFLWLRLLSGGDGAFLRFGIVPMAVVPPRRLRWNDTGAFRRRIAFVDESRLRWCRDARSGHFKSISLFKSIGLGQRKAWLGNACGYL